MSAFQFGEAVAGWNGQGHWYAAAARAGSVSACACGTIGRHGACAGGRFTCPNGHPYVITECGGAMETSRCPECGENIGGGEHRLLQTNRQFTIPQ
jgi:hypothetical protein